MKFCDNTICRCHVELPPDGANSNVLRYTEANGEEVTVGRYHIVYDGETKKEFDFCTICANVVAQVNGK